MNYVTLYPVSIGHFNPGGIKNLNYVAHDIFLRNVHKSSFASLIVRLGHK